MIAVLAFVFRSVSCTLCFVRCFIFARFSLSPVQHTKVVVVLLFVDDDDAKKAEHAA